jgi:predicted component of type VI protein secretion system
MDLSLVVLTSGKQGRVLEVRPLPFFVGRDPRCHLRPASPLIAARHCALLLRDGKAFVRPLGGAGRTFVNDRPVTAEVELHHDDRLKIGPLLFAVQLRAGTPVNEPTPIPPTRVPRAAKAPAAVRTPPVSAKLAAEAAEEDGVAALLLQDDQPRTSAGDAAPSPDSTVPGLAEPSDTLGGGEAPQGPAKDSKPKPAAADTASAAKAILDLYRARPRS